MASSSTWRTSPPVFTLTVDWSPYPIRVATRPVKVTTAERAIRQYGPGLEEPEIEERLTIGGQTGAPRDVTVRCLLPVDVSERMARGGHWFGVEGELALWSEAEPWEERVVLISGRVVPVSWGARGAPLELQITEPAWEDPAIWPPVDAAVTRRTWPDAPSGALGQSYPWVFGTAAGALRDEDGTAYSVPATPAIVVDDDGDRLLVAGHRVLADTVIIRNETRGASASFSVSTVVDGLGRYVSVVDFASETSGHGDPEDDWTAEDTYSVRDWADGGGHQAEDGPGPLRGLGDLILFFLRRSGITVDLAAWRALRAEMNRIEIGGYLDDPSPPLTIIRDVLLPLLPDFALASGPRGIRPVWWRPLSTPPVLAVTVGATWARVGSPTLADAAPVTDCVVSWGYDLESGEYRGRAGITSDPFAGDLGPTAHARTGRARHGRGENLAMESRWLWHRRCAENVARTTVRMGWTPPEQDALSAPVWVYPLLDLGQVIAVTDAEQGWAERRFWIAGRSLRGGRCELAIEAVDDFVSAPRRAS